MKGNCVIVDFVRSPLCKMGGGLKDRTVDQLGCSSIEAVMQRCGLPSEQIDHVIFGHAHIDTDPYNLARTAWLLGRFSEDTPGYSVHACGASGILAMQKAYYLFRTGNDLTAVVGGSESYSRAPYILRESRYEMDLKKFPIVDSIEEGEQWTQPTPMDPRDLAKALAEAKGYSAEELEALVAAEAARVDESLWENNFAPVNWLDRKKKAVTVDKDELPATEGTFASYVDGSVAMLMAEEERAAELGLKPIGRVLGFASAAGAPDNRWEPAVKAAAKLSAKFPEIAPESLTHIEVIADSAASTKAITEGLGLYGFKAEAVNPVGGSLAYGVNEGSDGVIAAGRALLNLRKTGAKYAIITAAMSGGQGMAMLIEAL